ncbi:alpha/beta hydrolase [Pseudahrensia aquimaris]|uniref:Alpha/beta hydrolase n=1 Tax=Pseudahrensia aquimaris TaxID=744461 RepID=A0ABW3FI16_9HYPH
MSDAIDYAKEYDNSGRVPNADELIELYQMDASFYREQRAEHCDLDKRYGQGERNRLDVFWPDEGKDVPLVMFIHGGYWQRLDRKSFSHMASGLNDHGIAVAIPSYTLCPQISVMGIINEMRRACILLHQSYGREIVTIGHSAGGHLSACMMATDWAAIHPDLPDDLVTAGMGISGLYDLAPILQTPINGALKLDEQSAHAASPHYWVPEGLHKFEAWAGEEESSEFHRQSRELAERWTMLGTPTNYVSVEGKNHFTVVDPLTRGNSAMVEKIVELVAAPAIEIELDPKKTKPKKPKAPEKKAETSKTKPRKTAATKPKTPAKTKASTASTNKGKKTAKTDESKTKAAEKTKGG